MNFWIKFKYIRTFRKRRKEQREKEVDEVILRARTVRSRAERLAAEARKEEGTLWGK